MVKTPVVKQKRFFLSFSLKNLDLFKILFFIFTFGFISGSILIGFNKDETLKHLGILMQKFINYRTEQSIVTNFFSSFFNSTALILILFVAGFIPIGQPISIFMPMFHGLGLGLSAAYLYSSGGLKGVAFCFLIIAPCEIVYTLSLLLAAKFSIRLSNKNFKNIFLKRGRDKNKDFLKTYILRFLTLLIFQFVAAIIDVTTTSIFAKFLLFQHNLV